MAKYIIRLDDAAEKMDTAKWLKMEELLDKYSIRPLVGIIPNCEDSEMDKYPHDSDFWTTVDRWVSKGWVIAMHGYNHVYGTDCGGINPVNRRSEFAGEPLDVQRSKIRKGVETLESHGISPKVFFAPSHTFDENTLSALQTESDIRIISDTVASDVYSKDGFTFVPLQTGRARKLPFKTVTCCYHPNMMNDASFEQLELFIKQYGHCFTDFPTTLSNRRRNLIDKLASRLYFARRK